MFPWDKERSSAAKPFRGNPNSKAGVAHRMCVMREKKQHAEAVQKHIKEFNLSKLYSEQDKKVAFNRKRNEMLQRAGEAALARAEDDDLRKHQDKIVLRQEELLAEEISRRKQEDETRRREIQRICENDEGLRDLQRKLTAAYMNKERHFQVKARHRDREEKKQREAEVDARLERERLAALREQEEKAQRLRERSIQQARINNEQITVKAAIEREDAYNEFMRDKRAVEKMMAEIADEIRQKEKAKAEKKERFKRDMHDALEMRRQELERRAAEEKASDIAAAEYRQTQDLRKKKAEEKAAAAAAAAEKIFNKLKADAERKRAEEERIREAIGLLRKEEADRRRDEAERRKRDKEAKSRREMMEANEAQKRHKVEMRAKEMEEESRLVERMMAKFKEDERKEKMEELERHQAKLRFKMNILDQLEEKRKKYEVMKARDEESVRAAIKEQAYRDRVVEEARKRLLMQHAAALREFLPKGVLQKMEDMKIVRASGVSASQGDMSYGDFNSTEERDAFNDFSARGSQRRAVFKDATSESGDRRPAASPRNTRPW